MPSIPSQSEARLCLNCDNRHGCRSARPLCLDLPRRSSERRLSGRQLMARRGMLGSCQTCELFRRCWTSEDYRRQTRSKGGSGA